ncbi:glycosyltransferase family 4 protein [Pseudoalteromonas sp. NSLLW218]|uniref:glycosyltransferase family 4 protein n=1 Tax=Pseudoalteromonas sp. NSLLW218 TaxID=2792048 RepID=UPI0018CF5EE4|nr:glycosyltransferase family 4 protein [Pseudoalteromonas sp. NSLLW218]MBH0087500.1 glycosyltransferase family 4 protein [Pseudoalteromonas sp. NSLLW218]
MKKNKKALILNSLYIPNIGGVENSMHEMSKSFKGKGYDVDIVCSNRNHVNNEILSERYTNEYSTIYRYNVLSIGYLKQIYNCYRLVRSLLKKEKYDSIISRGYVTSFCLTLLGVDYHYLIPSVIYEQNRAKFLSYSLSNKVKYLVSSLLQIISFNFASNIVFSKGMQEQVSQLCFQKKKVIIKNFGVDSSRFFPKKQEEKIELRKMLGLETEYKYLLCLGRFSELKGFDIAIKALSFLDDTYKLLLVGSGPEEKHYLRIIEESQLGDRVKVFGATTNPELFYQVSDIFFMTSRYESFGQVLLEATSSGLHVVAFKSGANILTNTNNIYSEHTNLVTYSDSFDQFGLADAVRKAYTSAVGENEFLSFLDKYSWDKLVDELTLKGAN